MTAVEGSSGDAQADQLKALSPVESFFSLVAAVFLVQGASTKPD